MDPPTTTILETFVTASPRTSKPRTANAKQSTNEYSSPFPAPPQLGIIPNVKLYTTIPPFPSSATSQMLSFARRPRVSRFVRDECPNRGSHAHLSTITQPKNIVRDCLAPPRLNTPQPQSSRHSSLPAPVTPSLKLGRPTSDVCDGSAAVAKP